MSFRLGFFQNFKGADTVVLSCDRIEMPSFRGVLADVMARGVPYPIHDLAVVSVRHPARLVLCPAAASFRAVSDEFIWRLNHVEFATVDSKLEVLEHLSAAHHCFDLYKSDVRLMVSVMEYNETWWDRSQ